MSEIVFIEYPRCTTCKKAKTWLDEHHVTYTDRNIKDDNPTKAELDAWIPASGLPLRRFFRANRLLQEPREAQATRIQCRMNIL